MTEDDLLAALLLLERAAPEPGPEDMVQFRPRTGTTALRSRQLVAAAVVAGIAIAVAVTAGVVQHDHGAAPAGPRSSVTRPVQSRSTGIPDVTELPSTSAQLRLAQAAQRRQAELARHQLAVQRCRTRTEQGLATMAAVYRSATGTAAQRNTDAVAALGHDSSLTAADRTVVLRQWHVGNPLALASSAERSALADTACR